MKRSSLACAGLRRSLLSREPLLSRPSSFPTEYVVSLAASRYSKFEPHQIGFASLYHTSTPAYARVAVAEVLDVESVQPTEKVVEKGDWQERKKQKAQQAEEVQKLVDSIGTIDYCHRLIHLFQIRRPPTLSHFHMLVKKIKSEKHLKEVVKVLKWYQGFAIETKEETAKLLVEAGLRSRQLRQVFHLFGRPSEYRLWPTQELCDITLDYLLEKNRTCAAFAVLHDISKRVDITLSNDSLIKLYDHALKRNMIRRSLLIGTYAKERRIMFPKLYGRLMKFHIKRWNVTEVLDLESQRARHHARPTSDIVTAAALAHLFQGNVQAAIDGVANASKLKSHLRVVSDVMLGCMEQSEKLKGPYEQFAQLLPPLNGLPEGVTSTEYALQLWKKEEENRAKLPKQPDSRRQARLAAWPETMEKLQARTKAAKAELRERQKKNTEERQVKIKVARKNRRKKTAKIRAAKRQEKEELQVRDTRVEAVRPIKVGSIVRRRPEKRLGRTEKERLRKKLLGDKLPSSKKAEGDDGAPAKKPAAPKKKKDD